MFYLGVLMHFAVSAAMVLIYSFLVVRSGQVEQLLLIVFLIIRGFWRFAGPIGIFAILAGGDVSDANTLLVGIVFAACAVGSFVGGSRFFVWLAAMAAQRRYSRGAALVGEIARTRLARAMAMWPKTFAKVCRRHATDMSDLRRVLCGQDKA